MAVCLGIPGMVRRLDVFLFDVGQSKPFVQVSGNYYVQCVCGYLCKPSIRGYTWKACLVHFGRLKGHVFILYAYLKILIPRYMRTVEALRTYLEMRLRCL